MVIKQIHPLNIGLKAFRSIQTSLQRDISLKNTLTKGIRLCAGVDLAYWEKDNSEWGICSIIVIDNNTKAIVEKVCSTGKVTFPYVPGYLALRELPLIVKAAEMLTNIPDLFLFDGNGYLHPRHMGIATHASFFLERPTIGVAKNYLRVHNTDFIMPGREIGSFEDIIVGREIYGRVLRTHRDVKPIFISCGNFIDLETTMKVILNLIGDVSRLPIPVRMADLETRYIRRQMAGNA